MIAARHDGARIVAKLDDILHDRRMTLANLSIRKTSKAKVICWLTKQNDHALPAVAGHCTLRKMIG